ncbi:J domain-containing protein [Coleofasciculus sp. LEGE 07081]|nr:J domain-containing protein [Coleofasciculus sp. LEGE 07081]
MLNVAQYYRVLDLQPGASAEEVHQGYLDMTWVWHPDRFVNHPRLQRKAHYKLQELNEAHEQLRSCQPTPRHRVSRPTSKSPLSSPPRSSSPAVDLYKPQVNRTREEETRRTVKDTKSSVSFKTSNLDDWLD